MTKQQELIPHLFRTEFRRITAVLCKYFGCEHIQLAEDIAGETFVQALETWPRKGIPPNPTAWLYAVAGNKARNQFRRARLFRDKVAPGLTGGRSPAMDAFEIDLTEKNITDSQLQMLFAVCHPVLPEAAQIALALRVLCGFGIEEIATAFLTNKKTIEKRLFRAKEKLRREKVSMEFPGDAEVVERLNAVLTTLYLLFSEGYYSESNDLTLRKDLCLEAMRLTQLLADNPSTCLPAVSALLALMCFHASRFGARKGRNGELILYGDQDERLWDHALIARGAALLHESARGGHVSRYHLEAGIAYWHTVKADTEEKWSSVLSLYDRLLQMQYSPVAALNRVYAFAKVHGNRKAIPEAERLQLVENPYYFALLGELYSETDPGKARMHFRTAYRRARTRADKQAIVRKLADLD